METRRKVAYIEFDRENVPIDSDAMAAYQGVSLLGYQIYPFTYFDLLNSKFAAGVYKTSVFVGATRSLTPFWVKMISFDNELLTTCLRQTGI